MPQPPPWGSPSEDKIASRAGYRRVIRSMRLMDEARMILDMLSHRLRDGGPSMTREEIKQRVDMAAEKINKIAPRSPLRESK